jgi:DNA-binding transcriptional LysR family regulator
MILVCNQGIREWTQKELTNKRIPRFISYNQASTTYKIIKASLQSLGIKVESTMSSTSPELIKQLVVTGKGVAVLPYSMVSHEVGNTLLNELVVDQLDLKRPIVSVSIDGAKIPSSLTKFDQYIKKLLN